MTYNNRYYLKKLKNYDVVVEDYLEKRKILEVENIARYYGIHKNSSLYSKVADKYNEGSNCIRFNSNTELHKWVAIDRYDNVNYYRCSKCGAIRRVIKK